MNNWGWGGFDCAKSIGATAIHNWGCVGFNGAKSTGATEMNNRDGEVLLVPNLLE